MTPVLLTHRRVSPLVTSLVCFEKKSKEKSSHRLIFIFILTAIMMHKSEGMDHDKADKPTGFKKNDLTPVSTGSGQDIDDQCFSSIFVIMWDVCFFYVMNHDHQVSCPH